ncbi:MAG: sulfatase-like hydrolase/transferase [Kordiimonadaceae bacterium]|nr:sulfatase-like hydrolase/transferase [Kordiimonadaceae bacterium]MBT6032272.1 sulfatase-like hydrolase/transferase [Kordiimonadaceae bacterium]
MTDDQGGVDVGSYGATDLKTPNLDALSEEGVRFTNFYAASAICSSSRAGLLTGREPKRAGVPGNVFSSDKIEITAANSGLPPSEVTIAEMMKGAGYRTALVGKWHLGHNTEQKPNAQGFDHAFGHLGGVIDNYSHFFYWNGPNRHDLQRNGEEVYADGEYFPDLMVKEAIDFIDQDDEKPFFLYYAINMPHYPYQGDQEWLDYYNDRGVAYPRNLYNAFVSSLDTRIGQIRAALKLRNIDDDTIIIFQSDHGHSTEQRAHGGGGSAGIYRGAKQSLFEGGLRVPAIIRWKNNIEAGGVRDQLASSLDWFATVAELTGIDVSNIKLDGLSLVSVIKDKSAPATHDELTWEMGGQWAVRKGNWKLLHNVRETTQGKSRDVIEGYFLVNLVDDPSESINVADQYPEKLAELIALRKAKELPLREGVDHL